MAVYLTFKWGIAIVKEENKEGILKM